MTVPRTFEGKRLLVNNPMTATQFRLASGWPGRTAERTLQRLVETGVAERFSRRGTARYFYRLVE